MPKSGILLGFPCVRLLWLAPVTPEVAGSSPVGGSGCKLAGLGIGGAVARGGSLGSSAAFVCAFAAFGEAPGAHHALLRAAGTDRQVDRVQEQHASRVS
jgi:hypothetical protein